MKQKQLLNKSTELSPKFMQVVTLMLQKQPNERPELLELKELPWFKLEKASKEEVIKEINDRIIAI